ncbi:MAG: hypothetical protein WCG93_09095 [Paludibacter sp.]
MKKITLLMLCIVTFISFANAATINVYVDPAKTDDSGDGLAWATAKQTITAAWTAAQLNAGFDNILVKGGTFNLSAALAIGASENYYGSCKGDETSAAGRPLKDNDGNGIIEPWEFEFPTVLNFTLNANALSLPNSSINFNGFTITQTGTNASGGIRTVTLGNASATFANNTIKNCNLTVSMPSASIASVLLKALGNVSNCLIENNTVTVNAAFDGSLYLVEAAVATAVPGTKILNSIIRNNKFNINYTSAGTLNNGNARGLILHVSPGTVANAYTTVSNCVINNNEMVYTPSGSGVAATMSNAATVALNNAATSTDSIINCTIVNNKGTKIKSAGLNIISVATTSHYVMNNVCWNNENDGAVSNITGGITVGLIANNYTNGGFTWDAAKPTIIYGNSSSLDAVTNTPNFKTPTTKVGNTTDGTSELSDWSLTPGSYLSGKGVVTSRLKDKAGFTFVTPRSVGSYQSQNEDTTVTFNANGAVSTYTNGQVLTNAIGTQLAFTITPNSGYKITSVLYNGVEVKGDMVADVYTAPALASNATLVVQFDLATSLDKAQNDFQCFSANQSLELRGLTAGDEVVVYTVSGTKVLSQKASAANLSIAISKGIYLIKVASQVKKVVVN